MRSVDMVSNAFELVSIRLSTASNDTSVDAFDMVSNAFELVSIRLSKASIRHHSTSTPFDAFDTVEFETSVE